MAPIGVMVVDDSTVVRRLVTDALQGDPTIKVVGTAANGRIALAKMAQLAPDVITLDVEMPVMDGIETIREIRKLYPDVPVIMFSTLTERGATATFQALSLGANDYVTKPANMGSVSQSIETVRKELVPRVKALYSARRRTTTPLSRPGTTAPAALAPGTYRPTTPATPGATPPPRPAPRAVPTPGSYRVSNPLERSAGDLATNGPGPASDVARVVAPRAPSGTSTGTGAGAPSSRVDLVVIGTSTGGPEALATLVKHLPTGLPVPIAIVQHMPPVFTRLLAERLTRLGGPLVHEATSGQKMEPGQIYLAPGDFHLEVVFEGMGMKTRLHQGPPENSCRPAVDVLFRSAVKHGAAVLAVVLTGMGADGRRGCGELRAAGARVYAQDEATSVVWGMPGAVTGAGFADEVLPLPAVVPAIVSALAVGRSPLSAARTTTGKPT